MLKNVNVSCRSCLAPLVPFFLSLRWGEHVNPALQERRSASASAGNARQVSAASAEGGEASKETTNAPSDPAAVDRCVDGRGYCWV